MTVRTTTINNILVYDDEGEYRSTTGSNNRGEGMVGGRCMTARNNNNDNNNNDNNNNNNNNMVSESSSDNDDYDDKLEQHPLHDNNNTTTTTKNDVLEDTIDTTTIIIPASRNTSTTSISQVPIIDEEPNMNDGNDNDDSNNTNNPNTNRNTLLTDNNSNSNNNNRDGSGSVHTMLLGTITESSKLMQCGLRFPRAVGILVGTIIPLWLLVIVAALFGYLLARIEAPLEIEQNDDIVANQILTKNLTNILLDLSVVTPRICWDIYKEKLVSGNERVDTNWDEDMDQILLRHLFDSAINITTVPPNGDVIVPINETTFFPFMYTCGVRATQITEKVLQEAVQTISASSTNLTFNWIVCTPEMNGFGHRWDHRPNTTALRPQAQTQYYTSVWQTNQQEIFDELMSQIPPSDDPDQAVRDKLDAIQQSFRNASGGTGCSYNLAGSGWFWFTVMTTIGYGNYVPETPTGQLLIYTVGFITILLFAIILNVSGYVISAIVEDFFVRFRARIFVQPWAATLLWGSAYYLWMLCIGNYTKHWFHDRLGYDMTGADAYWFSYVSTTTIGFGNIYLPAAVFSGTDLLVFPILFLIGFVFLAAFLQHLATFLNNIVRGGRDKPFLERIISQLAKVDILDEHATPVQLQDAIDAVIPPPSEERTR